MITTAIRTMMFLWLMAHGLPSFARVRERRRTRRPVPRAPQEVRDNSGGLATVPARRRDEAQRRRNPAPLRTLRKPIDIKEGDMNSIIWLVGAVVIVLVILSFFGLR